MRGCIGCSVPEAPGASCDHFPHLVPSWDGLRPGPCPRFLHSQGTGTLQPCKGPVAGALLRGSESTQVHISTRQVNPVAGWALQQRSPTRTGSLQAGGSQEVTFLPSSR